MSSRSRVIFVTGMHRSGTSALASYLAKAGATLPDDLISPGVDNPRGFFESQAVISLNEKILEQFGSHWRDPHPLPGGWLEVVATSNHFETAQGILSSNKDTSATLLLKDPRFCRTLPFWIKVCRAMEIDTDTVTLIRNPLSVARSLWTRNHIPHHHTIQLWCRYYLDLVKAVDTDRLRVVEFEQLVGDLVNATRVLDQLGLDVNSANQSSEVISSELVHHSDEHPVSWIEEQLEGDYKSKPACGLPNEQMLKYYYSVCGGDPAAEERRHYGVVAMVLDVLVEEKKQLEARVGALVSRASEEEQ